MGTFLGLATVSTVTDKTSDQNSATVQQCLCPHFMQDTMSRIWWVFIVSFSRHFCPEAPEGWVSLQLVKVYQVLTWSMWCFKQLLSFFHDARHLCVEVFHSFSGSTFASPALLAASDRWIHVPVLNQLNSCVQLQKISVVWESPTIEWTGRSFFTRNIHIHEEHGNHDAEIASASPRHRNSAQILTQDAKEKIASCKRSLPNEFRTLSRKPNEFHPTRRQNQKVQSQIAFQNCLSTKNLCTDQMQS